MITVHSPPKKSRLQVPYSFFYVHCLWIVTEVLNFVQSFELLIKLHSFNTYILLFKLIICGILMYLLYFV